MIKILLPEHALSYRELRLEALRLFPEYFGSGYEQQRSLSRLFFERIIEEQSSKGMMFGAFVGEQLVGICGVTFESDRLPNMMGEVIQMYVRPDHQNKGLATKLMRALLRTCQSLNVRALFLEVVSQNSQAIHLYHQMGFTEIAGESKKGDRLFLSLTL